MTKPLNDDELKVVVEAHIRAAIGFGAGKLGAQRIKAQQYYYAEATGDLAPSEVEGRSSVVVPVVRNTIQSMMPQLMVKFTGGDEVVCFEAQKPGDEPKAEQATDYINHLFYVRNPGEQIARDWMLDGLLAKTGVVKVWWDTTTEETREEYKSLSDVELAQLMDDEEVEITEQKQYPDEDDAEQRQKALEQLSQQLAQAQAQIQAQPPQNPQQGQQAQQALMQMQRHMQQIQAQPPAMLTDVVCKRVKPGGRVRVENVPTDEFGISRDAKNIAEAKFCGHRVQRTVSQLKSRGYKNVDQITSDDSIASSNMERTERNQFDDEYSNSLGEQVETQDESQRLVWLTECYIRVDADGDGISELRKVTIAGDQILDDDIVDVAPFVSICPVPIPHKFHGMSIADLAMEGQRTSTAIVRGVLDNMWLDINGRYYAVDGQVNLDDLMTSRPGGVVRMKHAGMAGRLDSGRGDTQLGMGMLEYMHSFNEESTGWTRYNGGNDGDTLNQTATGVNQITNRADMRLDMIARNYAQGFRDLFRMMLKLTAQFQSKEDIVKLRGEWVPVNPRDWKNGFDTTINVGLGTGSKDQQVAHLTMLSQQQQFGLQIGTTTPENVYQAQNQLAKALGFKNGDKFFTDPAKNPPPQQLPIEVQIEQMRQQGEAQKFQAQQQAEQAKLKMEDQQHDREMQRDMEMERNKQEMQARESQLTNQIEAERDIQKAQIQAQADAQRLEFDRWKVQVENESKIAIAELSAQVKVGTVGDMVSTSKQARHGEMNALLSQVNQQLSDLLQGYHSQVNDHLAGISQSHQELAGAVSQMAQEATQPTQIVRDANGRAVGVQRGGKVRPIQRGPDGSIQGL